MLNQFIPRTKPGIIAVYFIFAVLPIITLGIFINYTLLDYLRVESIRVQTIEGRAVAHALHTRIESTIATASLFAKRPLLIASIKKGKSKEVTRHLQSFIEGIPDIERITITNPAGKVIHTGLLNQSSIGLDLSGRDWYKLVKETGKPGVSEFYLTAAKPRYTFAFGIPMLDNGKLFAVMSVVPTADYLDKTIRPELFGKKITTYVVDKNGHLIYHSQNKVDKLTDYKNHPEVQMLLQGKEGAYEGKDPITNEYELSVFIPSTGFAQGVVIVNSAKDAFGFLYKVNIIFAVIMIITVFMAIFGSIINAHLIFTVKKQSDELISINEALNEEVAERKKTAEKIALIARELERSNKDLDDFAYVASHDLKEPLRGIHNYSSFLLEDYVDMLDDDGKDKLRTLVYLTKRLEGFINDLLKFSRVGRVALTMTQTAMDEVVNDVLTLLKHLLEKEHIDIRIPRPLPTVKCDNHQIVELLQNLISNAVKYNDKNDKWVEIGYNNISANDYTFYVRDNGIGIDKNYFDSIFTIFKRLHSRDKFGGGTGAGLTIVKKIIERHGGKIWLESIPAEGTTFYFTLQGEKNVR